MKTGIDWGDAGWWLLALLAMCGALLRWNLFAAAAWFVTMCVFWAKLDKRDR